MGTLNRSFTRSHVHVLLFFLFMSTVIWAPTASADSVSWAGIAPNWEALLNPFTTTSAGGIMVTGSMPPGESVLATLECLDPSTITPCLDGGFLLGGPLLFTNYKTGPLTFSFSQALQSISTQINTIWYGPFSATLTAYSSGGGVLGTTTVNGSTASTHDGSAPLLSFTSGAGIYSVSITAASQSPLSNYDAFFINQLNITPLAIITVSLDIKPGSFPNSINPTSKGVISVAILTTATFDATTVDPLTVKFGPNEATESHGKGHIEDADNDGSMDMILHFKTQDTGIQCGDTSASLTGETFDGQPIEGSDSIKTVGCK